MSELTSGDINGTRFSLDYGNIVEGEIAYLRRNLEHLPTLSGEPRSRWLVIKLLEGDEDIIAQIQSYKNGASVITATKASIQRLQEHYGEDIETVIAGRRYSWINALVQEAVQKNGAGGLILSDRIDKLVTHRWLGIPIFLAAMWIVFKLTTDISAHYLNWVDGLFGTTIARWIVAVLDAIGLGNTWVESLFVDGVIAGVGGVMVFVPVLIALYLALAILEDTGYMARAAFVMDRLMQKIGLQGKSFLPMLVGFGCTVPAFYATRTLENEKDRVLTGLLVPFMSCGARLPVYVLFAAIFFPKYAGIVVFGLYLLGVFVAIILGVILKSTVFRGKDPSNFVMELPPYRRPTLRSIWGRVWSHTKGFIQNAWTIILATSVILWFLMAIPAGGRGNFADTDLEDSLFATLSGVLTPALEPLGFGNWESSGALLTGFVAKEVVISTLSQTHGIELETVTNEPVTFLEDIGSIVSSFADATVDTLKSIPALVGINLFPEEAEGGQTELMAAVRQSFETTSGGYGSLAGLSFMVFVLIYTPCMAAITAERQELGAKWMWVSIFGQLILAWLLACLVFQGGKILGLG